MNIANTYPVFEPDQVLTNKHLNSLFDYLDQQDRLTRIKLIGSGIVCGLDITYDTESIKISKGCGLTSQGFLITYCDSVFKQYINYTTQNFPADLHFIQQCPGAEAESIPFYKEAFKEGIFQLVTDKQAEDLHGDQPATRLANTTIKLDDYVVVLFLESIELALKNCDTNDCNDKGSEMDFEVKALLVEKIKLDGFLEHGQSPVPGPQPTVPAQLHHVELQRYNVPVHDLKTADDVLQAFADLTADAKLKTIAEVLNYCYLHYYYLLKDEPSNPFALVFEQFKNLRNDILTSAPVLIQYFYDFIDDVLKAYYEFKHKVFQVSSECCGDEMKFSLHLMLGEATVNTASSVLSRYRHYFIYSPLFYNQANKLEEVRLLFTRMRIMVQQFLLKKQLTAAFLKDHGSVKITPSTYGHTYLSKRCIPYYYNVIAKENTLNELYRYWSYDKTSRGNERFNLGYNAYQYNSADTVVQPLLYDIERFNFFRVEGHIGKDILTATSIIKSMQQRNNLPFDIVALSADFIGALVKGEEPKCVIQDLESDYRVIIAEFICKLHDAFCFVARLPFKIPERILRFSAALFADATVEDAAAIKTTMAFDPALLEKADHPFASALVNEFQALKNYTKGDTLSRLCNPAANTIGSAYVNMKGQFSNPVTINTEQPVTMVQFHAFEFLDATESVLELVINFELADINVTELKKRYDRFEKEARSLSLFAISFLQKLENNDKTHLSDLASDLYLDLLIFNLEMLLHLCFIEQVEALNSEYRRRMAQYRLAKNFSYYFKTHGGIEHKAGVPVGGTFILVYHEERKGRYIDPNSLIITKELRNLTLANFRELVKSEVPLDKLIYKTELLQASLFHNEQELFLKTKKFLTNYLEECKDLPDDKRKELTAIIDEEPKRPRFEFKDGMVIADFYVPYMCCSDCPPVAYILPPPPKDEHQKPALTKEDKIVCSSSDNKIRLFPTPAGGSFTVDGIQKDECFTIENGGYFFTPKNLNAGSHSVIYSVDGIPSNQVIVNIVATPKAGFTPDKNKANIGEEVTFTNNSQGIDNTTQFEWLVNNVMKSTLKDFTYKVQEGDKELKVILSASNGICKDTSKEVDIIIEKEIIKKSISLCSNFKSFELQPRPAATDVIEIISNDGVKLDKSSLTIGPFLPGITQTVVNVSYSVNDQQTDLTITRVVLNADFTINIRRDKINNQSIISLSLESIAKNYTTNEWEIQPEPINNAAISFKDDPLKNINISEARFREAKKITITHRLSAKVDSGQCTASEPYELLFDNLPKALKKKDFNNHFKF